MFYAVRTGRNPGIYDSWNECFDEVNRYPQARYKKFSTREEALEFVNGEDYSSGYSSGWNRSYSDYSSGYSTGRKRSYTDYSSGYSTGRNRSYTDSAQSAGSRSGSSGIKRFRSTYEQDCAGWSGKPFSDPTAASVYTDGACFQNGKNGARAGIGVYWGPGNRNNVAERLEGRPTNNRAEIHAAIKAVKQAKQMGNSNLVVNTDSQFLINSTTKWMKGWKKNDWTLSTGGPVANREDFEELDEAVKDINVKWVHVRGHEGVPGNEAADRLANAGARKTHYS